MDANRIRRIIASDDVNDVLVLTDSPTISIYTKTGGPASASSSSAIAPIYSLRTAEARAVLPNAPIDAAWCPYKQGDANSSYLATSWGSGIRLLDMEDGTDARAVYYTANTMDEVAFAQSLLWLRAPQRQEQFIAGYGRSMECCVALFDVMREGKNPLYTYEPTAAKCCNYSADAASANVVVSALAEIRNNLVAFGTLRGSVELLDLRSKCCAGAISGRTANGSGHSTRGPAATANFMRHTAGIVQIVGLDGISLENTRTTVANANAASTTNKTATDDYRFLTVPRSGDDCILAWDMRNLSNPIAAIDRGVTNTNTYRNVCIDTSNRGSSSSVIISTQSSGVCAMPLTEVFGGGIVSADADGVKRIKAADYAVGSSASISLVAINPTTDATPSAGTVALTANKAPTGPIALVGSSTIMTSVDAQPFLTAKPAASLKYVAAGNGVGLTGVKRARKEEGAGADGAATTTAAAAAVDEEDTDFVVLRSRRVYANKADGKIVISDADDE